MSYKQSSRSMSSVLILAAPIVCPVPCTTTAEGGTQCFVLSSPAELSSDFGKILLLFVGLSDKGERVEDALLLIVTALLGWEQPQQIDAQVPLRSSGRDIKRGVSGFGRVGEAVSGHADRCHKVNRLI